jgi:hypothetical protein
MQRLLNDLVDQTGQGWVEGDAEGVKQRDRLAVVDLGQIHAGDLGEVELPGLVEAERELLGPEGRRGSAFRL